MPGQSKVLGVVFLALLLALPTFAFPRPTIYGQIANTHIEGTVIFWDEIQVAYDRITLNVTAPCGDLSQVFERGETPFFDVGKLTGEVDGTYTFDLVATPTIDPSVQKALAEVRGTAEEKEVLQSLWDKGLLPRGPFRQAGFFEVERGLILPQDTQEESGAKAVAPGSGLDARHPGSVGSSPGESTDGRLRNIAAGTVLTNANGVIRNSLCVGFDCPDSPTFSDTTILMMENNTRIKFDDTSTINNFPRNDWEIEANSNLNGGGSWLAINDCGQSSQGGCANDPLVLVEAGAPANSLRIDNGGRVGLGTANPVVELHVIDGDTPTLRLDQDGSSGFAQQVWDVAGNETSFFIRDATNGSQLPFRIRPGADSNSLVIDADNDIGLGILSPTEQLHLRRTDGSTKILVEEGSATTAERELLRLKNAGKTRFAIENTAASSVWNFSNDGSGNFEISKVGTGNSEFLLTAAGNLTITGSLTANGSTFPDYVFAPDYELMPLADLQNFIADHKHLPSVPSAAQVEEQGGHNMTELQLKLLEKVEELTLYTLQQEEKLSRVRRENGDLCDLIQEMKAQSNELQQRLELLEELLD